MQLGNYRNMLMMVACISAAAFGFSIAATAGDKLSPAVEHKVDIQNFIYDPDPIIVNVGDTITWTNLDIVPHTATLSDIDIGTGDIPTSESRSIVTIERGELNYICRYHANMHGKIQVL